MIFPAPKWVWRLAYEPVRYGFVSNKVTIYWERGSSKHCHVTIPTELFLVLDAVLTDSERAVAVEQGLEFFVDEHGDRWVFGLQTPDSEFMLDLWYFTRSTAPNWFHVAISKR